MCKYTLLELVVIYVKLFFRRSSHVAVVVVHIRILYDFLARYLKHFEEEFSPMDHTRLRANTVFYA